MTQTEILLGLMLALTVTACWQMVRSILAVKKDPSRYMRPVGRRMMLTTVTVLAIPVLVWLGQKNWGNMTSLYAFIFGLATVNVIWLRKLD